MLGAPLHSPPFAWCLAVAVNLPLDYSHQFPLLPQESAPIVCLSADFAAVDSSKIRKTPSGNSYNDASNFGGFNSASDYRLHRKCTASCISNEFQMKLS